MNRGAQIVIALIHAGDNYDSKTGPVFDVANQLGGVIDAVLGGDTHDKKWRLPPQTVHLWPLLTVTAKALLI